MSEKSRPKGLGRGLNALFDDDEELVTAVVGDSAPAQAVVSSDPIAASGHGRTPQTLGVEQLTPSAAQPRTDFDQESLDALAASMAIHGVLQPLLVRQKRDDAGELIADEYEIIAGERRWRAAQLAQLHEVPVVIRELEDKDAMEIALIENLQREDLNPVEEARAYKRLMDEYNYTQAQLAEALGCSRSQIGNMTRMLVLDDQVLDMVRDGRLSAGHARTLITLDDPLAAAEFVIRKGMSVRGLEVYAKSLNTLIEDEANMSASATNTSETLSSAPPKSPEYFDQSDEAEANQGAEPFTADASETRKPSKSPDLIALEDDLSARIGMNVNFDMVAGSNTEGRISVDFKTLDQLDLLITALKRAASGDQEDEHPLSHRLMD